MTNLLSRSLPYPACQSCGDVQFRTLAEQIPDVVMRMDANGRFIHVNSRIEELTGIPAGNFFGKTCREVGLPDHCASLLEEMARDTLAEGRKVNCEVQVELNGSRRNLHIRTVADQTFTTTPVLIATVQDITPLRHNEHNLEETVQRLSHHVHNTPLAVMEWKSDGKYEIWNREAEEMFGWSLREMRKKTIDFLEWIHPDDRQAFSVILDRLKQGQVVSDFAKCRTLHRTGGMLFCECHLSVLLDSEGHAKSLLCVANDVTPRELADQEMHLMNADLESRIRERTFELEASNQRLQKEILARKALEAELISISEREHRRVGHDLHDGVCQELSGVRFSLEAISRKRRRSTALREQMDLLTAAIERAVHHIRLLSRGLAPLELEDGNLAAALDELAANTSTLFRVECKTKSRGRSNKLGMDKAINLFRIAQEAIQNAIKHGDAKQILIDLDLIGGRLMISDNGNGFKENPPAPAPGSGMGHKIMNHRAAAIQGTVSLQSNPAGGVRVTCLFKK